METKANSTVPITQSFIKDPSKAKLDALTTIHIAAYSVGHFLNDLTAAIWFNYLLFYMKNIALTDIVVGTDSVNQTGFYAGYLIIKL